MLDAIGSRALAVPATGGNPETQDDLVSMLADMDARLRALQHELESVALPLARSARKPPQPRTEVQARPTDTTGGQRIRATRRIKAVTGGVAAAAGERDTARRLSRPAAPQSSAQVAVQRTIQEADEEARRVVEDARLHISEIGARTREQLERSLAERPGVARPATGSGLGRWASSARAAELRDYEGEVTITAGPFVDILQLGDFESTLASIPGVAGVHIRALDHQRALFDVDIVGPTRLIAELRDRATERLRVLEAGDRDVSVEVVMDAVAAR